MMRDTNNISGIPYHQIPLIMIVDNLSWTDMDSMNYSEDKYIDYIIIAHAD